MSSHRSRPTAGHRPVVFADRGDAGRRLADLLADELPPEFGGTEPIVLALPRGGVPVAHEVAGALGAPLDVLAVRKLGAPSQPELAMGAIAPDGVRAMNEGIVGALGIGRAAIERVAAREGAELERRVRAYRAGRPPLDVRGRTVVLVDDGIATGATARAALLWLRRHGAARVVLAAPVIASDAAADLEAGVEQLVAVTVPTTLDAIGAFYDRFDQVHDDEVRSILGAEREVRLPVGGVTLFGSLALPVPSRGVVLFAHGSGSGRRSPRNRHVAAMLRASGLGTLLMDLLTEDEERVDDRTGRLRFDIPLLAHRLAGAIDWLARTPTAGGLPIGLFGASTGGGAALVAAVERPDAVAAVVSRGGRPDLAGPEVLARVRAPTLLIVGGADEEVLALNRGALDALRCPKRLAVVPGATHLFEEPGALDAVGRLAAEWFVAHGARAPVERG